MRKLHFAAFFISLSPFQRLHLTHGHTPGPLLNRKAFLLTGLLGAIAATAPRHASATERVRYALPAPAFLPAFTQSVGYDSNPDQTTASAAKGSMALRSDAELVEYRAKKNAVSIDGIAAFDT